MDVLTFRDEIGQREFVLLRSTQPIVKFKEYYFTVSQVFPYVEIINWQWGYMIADNKRIIVSKEAPQCLKLVDYCMACQVILTNLN